MAGAEIEAGEKYSLFQGYQQLKLGIRDSSLNALDLPERWGTFLPSGAESGTVVMAAGGFGNTQSPRSRTKAQQHLISLNPFRQIRIIYTEGTTAPFSFFLLSLQMQSCRGLGWRQNRRGDFPRDRPGPQFSNEISPLHNGRPTDRRLACREGPAGKIALHTYVGGRKEATLNGRETPFSAQSALSLTRIRPAPSFRNL